MYYLMDKWFKIISKRTVSSYIGVYKNGQLDEDLTYSYNGSKETGPHPVSTTTITPVTFTYTPNASVSEIKVDGQSNNEYSYLGKIVYNEQELNFTLPVIAENNGKSLSFDIQGNYKEYIFYSHSFGYVGGISSDNVTLYFKHDVTSSEFQTIEIDSYMTKYKDGNNTGITESIPIIIDTENSTIAKFEVNIIQETDNENRYKVVVSLKPQYVHENHNQNCPAITETVCLKQSNSVVDPLILTLIRYPQSVAL